MSVGAGGVQANGASSIDGMSTDARYVMFDSGATNLVSSDTNGVWDVFAYDRTTTTTKRLSVSSSSGGLNAYSSFVGMSRNGRYVAFRTSATNVGTATQAPANIYVRDLVLNTTTGFFYGLTGGATPDGDAWSLHISDNGQYIAFSSSALNITSTQDSGLCGQVGNGASYRYFRDTVSGINTFMKDSAIFQGSSDNGFDMTPDGRYVLYGVSCINSSRLNDGGFYRYDSQTSLNDAVAMRHPIGSLSVVGIYNVSDDGGRVYADGCFTSTFSCPPLSNYLWDGTALMWVHLTSFVADGRIAPDGKNVLMTTNEVLDPIDTNGSSDVYLFAAPPAGQLAPTGGAIGPGELFGGCGCGYASHAQVTPYPIDTASGNFWHSFDDLAIPGRGAAIDLSRTYNSLAAATDGPFGFGWTHPYGMTLTIGGSTTVVNQENGSQGTFTLNGATWSAPPRVFATLVHNGDGTWTYTRRAREIFQFDSSGRLTTIKDLNGYVTSVTYPSGTSQVITDPAGRTVTLTFVGSHVTGATDASTPPRTLTYTYDVSGNLTDVIDVGGGHWQFTYDAAHRLLTMRSPRFYGDTTTTPSPVVTNVYDGAGRATQQTDPLGRATNFDYTYVPGATKVTDPKGNMTLYYYTFGLLTALTRAWGTSNESTWIYRYDVDTIGKTLTVDPNGHSSAATYDSAGNMLTKTDGLSRTTTYTYSGLREVTSITEPKQVNGHAITSTTTYDAAGNPRVHSSPLLDANGNTTANAVTTYHYDDASHPGDVTSVTDPNSNTASFTYDTFGDLTAVTMPPTPENATGNKTTYGYDTAKGWRISMVSPKGNVTGGDPAAFTTSYARDAYGRPTVTKDPLWTSTTPTQHQSVRRYDADGNLDSLTDGNNHATTYAYDPAGQQTQIRRADGSTLRADYFADGTLNHQFDGANQPTTYTYDELGHLYTVADPLGRTTYYGYDALENLKTLSNPSNRTTTYGYDAADELTSMKYSDGTTPNVTSIAYDADGQRTTMSDGTGTSTWAWNTLHRLTSSTNGAGQIVGYGYDLGGRMTTITYPGATGSVIRTYDAANRLASVKDWANRQTNFAYDADSNLLTQGYPNTSTATNTFDNADRLMVVSHAPTPTPALPFASFTYARDGANLLSSVVSTGVPSDNHAWSYNAINELTGVDASTYNYDSADNLTKRTDGTNQGFDVANEVLSATNTPAISFVGTASAGDATSTSLNLALPAGTTANDQILLAVTLPYSKSVTTPSGYTVVGTYTSGTSNTSAKVVVFRRTVVAGDTSVTVSFGTKFAKTVTLGVYRNVNPASPIDVAGVGGAAAPGTTVTAPAVTTTGTGDSLLMISGASGSASTWTAPSGMTTQVQKTGGTTDSAISDQVLTGPGTTGIRTATHSASTQLVGVLVALRPAQGIYTYDAQGNRVTSTPAGGATVSFSFDQANRLTSYGTSATYAYNGDGLRTSKTVSGASTAFTWDVTGSLPLLLVEGTNKYVYGPGGLPLERIDSTGAVTFYHHDQLGSTRALTNSTGTVVATDSYDAYGNLSGSTGTVTNPFGYAGQYTDSESGLQYLRARYYDPVTGQFINRDPITQLTRQPYSYVQANPLNASDPSGLCWPLCAITAAIGAFAGAFGTILSGNMNPADIAMAAFVGAAVGFLFPENPVLAGAVGGAITNLFNQTWQNGISNVNYYEVAASGLIGAGLGGVGGFFERGWIGATDWVFRAGYGAMSGAFSAGGFNVSDECYIVPIHPNIVSGSRYLRM
ncbi:MAG: RHS repeat-associated core domain-containing protein [Actinomycetota bacterium]|nr:DUF6531 domain-containing protein [Actinomycetota bacterium]